MTWNKLSNLVTKRHSQRGLGPSIAAGMICQKAESLYPDMFKAVSLRNGLLTIAVHTRNRLKFKLIEGALLAALTEYAAAEHLPNPERIRLTDQQVSDSV